MFDINNIPMDDQDTWDMICEGRVKGCFQIESHLGKTWCKKIKPRNIEDLSAVIALIRPGALLGMIDGKTIANHYSDRRDGKDEVKIIHPSIKDVLSSTYGVFIYQEDILKVAQVMSKFNMKETLKLQKGIGKKDAKVINELKERFVSGCVKNGISKEIGEDVFSAIQKSGRYLFNKSHSVQYAIESYQSAYIRKHHILYFLKNWLRHAEEKVKPDIEIKQLVNSSKIEGVKINGPDSRHLIDNFFIKNKEIYFGICNIKNVGTAHLNDLISNNADKIHNWPGIAVFALVNINKRAVDCLIRVGTFSHLKVSRSQMIHDMTCLDGLTDKELDFIRLNFDPNKTIAENVENAGRTKKEGGPCGTAPRAKKVLEIVKRLKDPGRSMYDSPIEFSREEERLMGVSIYHNSIDSCEDASYADSKCSEFESFRENGTVAAVIKEIKNHKTKKGDDMAFLEIEDDSGVLENVVVFPEAYALNQHLLYEESTVLLTLKTNIRGSNRSYVVERMYQI